MTSHDEHDHSHPHGAEESTGPEQPFDAANQSLSDALRASFRILKGIMLVLLVLYLFSNVRTVGSHEQALIMRFGRLLPTVHDAGLVPAMPFPIDEILSLPTRKSNELSVDSHSFHRLPEEVGKTLAFIHRTIGQGLHPVMDGALLTSDSGIVHVRWKITYKIENVEDYVKLMADAPVGQGFAEPSKLEAADRLLRTLVETTGIHVAAEMTAEEVTRTRVDRVREEMLHRINSRLKALKSGIHVTLVEVYEPTPPLQIRDVFDNTQRAENAKQRRVREAEQERIKILNEAAGAAYGRLVQVLDAIDRHDPAADAAAQRGEADEILLRQVEGKAGKMLKNAESYYALAVGQMKSELKLYRELLPEYKRNPSLLIGRLWEQTRQEIFGSMGVTKLYRPAGLEQFRIKVPLDPEQTRMEEEQRLQKKEFDPRSLRPEPLQPFGVEAG